MNRKLSWIYCAALACLAIATTIAAMSIFYTPFDPYSLNLEQRFAPPQNGHFFGFDNLGRDMVSRIMIGVRTSMLVSMASVGIALCLGIFIGLMAGYYGGIFDRIANICINALLALPGILLALMLLAILGAGIGGLVFALGLAYSPNIARIVRGETKALRNREYIEAAKVMGHGHLTIIWRHILPNLSGPLTILASSYFAQAFLTESALSFIGLGIAPPEPSLGSMLADSQRFMDRAPWLAIIPGMVMTLILLSINLCGDVLRDYFDPHHHV